MNEVYVRLASHQLGVWVVVARAFASRYFRKTMNTHTLLGFRRIVYHLDLLFNSLYLTLF
jgi:hypothetical protein